jgi:anti-sigma regulatory factor (Ser/Thr protein kinase)
MEDAMSSDQDGRPVEVGQATLPCGPEAPSLARSFVSSCLDGHAKPELRDHARLLVSELVTNSLQHSGQGAGAPLHIRAVAADGLIRIEVKDHGRLGAVRRRAPDDRRGGGFGLHLVDLLAARWGVSHEDGTLVWFELHLRGA